MASVQEPLLASVQEPLLADKRCDRADSCYLSDGTVKQFDSTHKKVGSQLRWAWRRAVFRVPGSRHQAIGAVVGLESRPRWP